jgi:hypothetical protein
VVSIYCLQDYVVLPFSPVFTIVGIKFEDDFDFNTLSPEAIDKIGGRGSYHAYRRASKEYRDRMWEEKERGNRED